MWDLMWDSIAGTWDHDLSRKQTLKECLRQLRALWLNFLLKFLVISSLFLCNEVGLWLIFFLFVVS